MSYTHGSAESCKLWSCSKLGKGSRLDTSAAAPCGTPDGHRHRRSGCNPPMYPNQRRHNFAELVHAISERRNKGKIVDNLPS